ncbi:MAG: type I restriction enzyme HsdR N-terminal domain-containing protein, partial [Candidatus Micrarchaeaceae archaeon]
MNNQNETLASIVEKIKKFRSLYEQNEMAVRDQIVNPILRNLGWNPENPEEVLPNVSTEEGVPDYSLIKNGKKILFVEAKKLSVDIGQKEVIRQLAKYSFSEGTKYGVLTNGAVWILIRSFEEGTPLSERIVWKVDLENEELPAVLKKIVVISKTNIEDIEVLVKKAQILDEIWQSLLDKP